MNLWPVLVGETGETGEPSETDAVLASPIILYDHPQLAPESPGDVFDAAEVDEILSLRVMTLTDDEKRAASDLDPRAAELLERTDALACDLLMSLHGTMRAPRKVTAVHVGDAELRPGDRVRLNPGARPADAFDFLLRGKPATIAAIERGYDERQGVRTSRPSWRLGTLAFRISVGSSQAFSDEVMKTRQGGIR